MRRRCLEHQHCDNEVGWGATDGATKSGVAMDAHAPPRLQCIVETPPNPPSVFVFGFAHHGFISSRVCMQIIPNGIRSQQYLYNARLERSDAGGWRTRGLLP